MGGKDRRRLFWELFLMMVIVAVLTAMMFFMSGYGDLLSGANLIVTAVRMIIIMASAVLLSYFEASNITKSVDIIRKALNKIKHADLRERIYMDEDNLFSDLSVEANAFMDTTAMAMRSTAGSVSSLSASSRMSYSLKIASFSMVNNLQLDPYYTVDGSLG